MTKSQTSSSQKVVIVTGSSTGIGRAAVETFSKAGWIVAATMRTPAKEKELGNLPGVELKVLDVTNTASIKQAIKDVYDRYGRIDAVVNNAGYGLVGVFEDTTEEQIRRQFETNVFGLMAVCREVIPYLRKQGFGRIINISSVGGRITLPLYSSYHSTKWAVEGFTESLQFELAPFGIRTVLIEPGAIKTDFYDRSADRAKLPNSSPYKSYADQVYNQFDTAAKGAEGPQVVAKKILQAASVKSPKTRYAVGGNAPALIALRKVLPESVFTGMVKMILKA
jgi:NAD(P)-dependent dehydrogenase (short-subunit alcohol dehydrogenase family)